ncbi:Cytochrome b5 [Papilio machaon]|uniref:Cytochrome b5 n=1 Tax=Papilio machaon TaxID=76193 RepID=A0A0N0PBL7_PAPMA|nr:Cytochrome b5 [Papilio machaon]
MEIFSTNVSWNKNTNHLPRRHPPDPDDSLMSRACSNLCKYSECIAVRAAGGGRRRAEGGRHTGVTRAPPAGSPINPRTLPFIVEDERVPYSSLASLVRTPCGSAQANAQHHFIRITFDCSMGEVKRFSRAEVAQHKGRAGGRLWLVYKDSVYDLTDYLAEHPAGDAIILEEGGEDVSKAFDEVGHSGDARDIMAKYKIGEVNEDEKYYDEKGKKKKRVVEVQPEDGGGGGSRSLLGICCCGLLR